MNRPYNTVDELVQAIKDTEQFSTNDTKKILLALPMMIRQNQEIISLLKRNTRRKRAISNWNEYVAKGLKAGLPMKKIAENWRFIKGHYSK